MTARKRPDYASRLEAIQAAAITQISAVADEFRRDVLVPFCRRYRFEFFAGNGTWVFVRLRDGQSIDSWAPVLKPYEAVLNAECLGRDDLFGFYVANVRRGDL